MGSPKKNENKGFFAAMTSGFSMFGSAMSRSVNGSVSYELLVSYLSEFNMKVLVFVCI